MKMNHDFSPEFAEVMRGYVNCKNLTDTQVQLIAVFLRAINTPHYRCGINFKKIELRHNCVIFNWRHSCELATFDYRELTQIVLFAHQYSIRIGLAAICNGIFKVSLSQAKPFDMDEQIVKGRQYYHPSLEQALKSQNQTQWLQDQAENKRKRGVIWA